MDWQLATALTLVALSGLYVLRAIRRAVGKRNCGSGCGKCAPEQGRAGMIALEQVEAPKRR